MDRTNTERIIKYVPKKTEKIENIIAQAGAKDQGISGIKIVLLWTHMSERFLAILLTIKLIQNDLV